MKRLLVWIAALLLLGTNGFAGDEPSGKVNAYYYASYADEAAVTSKLKTAGFEIVASYAPTEKSKALIITNEALKTAANKPGRGFAAILRVLIDNEDQRVAVTNPVYFGKAFLEGTFDYASAAHVTEALKGALGALKPSEDAYDYDDLEGYHFMMGMPYYSDVYELGEGDTAALLAKLDGFNGGKSVVFKLNVGDGKTLIGFDLDKKTNAFVKKIGTRNAEILPYTILVENGKATALAAKYYIAISYPMLSMGDFMKISSVPGEIENELAAPFK